MRNLPVLQRFPESEESQVKEFMQPTKDLLLKKPLPTSG